MTRILALDVATSMGFAAYDTDRHPSAMECGTVNLSQPGATGVEKRRLMRLLADEQTCVLINRFRPDVACIEQPLNYIKAAMGTGKKLPMFRGEAAEEKPEKGGPNADTVLMLNQLFAVVNTVCEHKCKLVIEVAPKTWQTMTSQFKGNTKERSIAFCRQLRIEIPMSNKVKAGDAADAAVIAMWAAGRSQELKLLERSAA